MVVTDIRAFLITSARIAMAMLPSAVRVRNQFSRILVIQAAVLLRIRELPAYITEKKVLKF